MRDAKTRLFVVAAVVVMGGVVAGPAQAEARPGGVRLLSNSDLVNSATGMCLTVHGASKAKGAKIDLYRCVGKSNQKWTMFTSGPRVYEIQNQNSGLCIDVPGNSTKNGVLLVQWSCNGKSNQNFQFFSAGGNSNFYISGSHSQKLAQPKYHDRRANNPVHQWSSRATWAKWHH